MVVEAPSIVYHQQHHVLPQQRVNALCHVLAMMIVLIHHTLFAILQHHHVQPIIALTVLSMETKLILIVNNSLILHPKN
jgi:hypothetical protein